MAAPECFFVLANKRMIWYDATAVQEDSAGSRTSQHKKLGTYMNKESGTLCVSLVFVCRRFFLRFFMRKTVFRKEKQKWQEK